MKFDHCNKKQLFCCVCPFLRCNLSLLLILSLLPMCLAVPVMAEEMDDSGWVQLLDYGYPIGLSSNRILLSSNSSSTKVTYVNPNGSNITYFDVFFRSDIPSFDVSTSYGGLTLVSYGNGFYRAYGSFSAGTDTSLYFWGSGGTFVDIYSYRISYLPFDSITIPVSATINAMGYPNQIFNTSYPDSPYCSWTYDSFDQFEGASTNGIFTSDFRFTDWKRYDFVQLQLGIICSEIHSVSAYIGDQNVLLDVSVFESASQSAFYYLHISADLRGFDRSSSDVLTIVVNGAGGFKLTNQLNIFDACGLLSIPAPSLWTYWFSNLEGWLSSGFGSISTTLNNNFSDFGSYLYNWFTEQNLLISNSFTDLTTNLTNWFNTQTSTLSNTISNMHSDLIVYGQTITSAISSWGQSVVNSFNSGVDRIVDAITGGDNADDLQQGADQIGEAGSSLGSNIGSIQDFEDQYFGQLDTNMGTIISGGNISGIVAPLAFVQRYTNMIVAGIPSNFLVIFTLPILLGIFMFMVNHRIKVPRPDRSSDYVTHEVGGHKNDGNS